MEQSVRKQKILVVDDEQGYREVISIALSLAGYETIEAVNGLEGLAAAREHHPDLILCDVNMPKMDGYDLLNSLKTNPEFAEIPFVFLTGNSASGDLRKGMLHGADDYLTKPFSAEDLIKAVEIRIQKNKSLRKYFENQFDDIKSNIVQALPHEFRTPLNGILGFSQLLTEEQGMSEQEIQEIGTMINRSGKRLQHLLENMVLFGQLQLWRHDRQKIDEMRRESGTSLHEVIRTASDAAMNKHERPDAIRFSDSNALIPISAVHFTKIVEEILDNALKFSDKKNTVGISIDEVDGRLRIAVRDKGRGMTEEQIGKISGFHQFERGYYEQQGAGLGLTIAKSLTELYNGTLTIVSEEKKGTTVTLTLPIVPLA